MTTIIYVLASLLLGGFIGLAAYWPLRTARRVYRVGAGIALGLLAVLSSFIIFLYAGAQYPGIDEARFSGQSRIEVIRATPLAEKDANAVSQVRVLLAFPPDARRDYDFTVRLVVSASPPLSPGNYKAVLSTAKNFEVRPLFACPSENSKEISGVSCARYLTGSELELRWDVTPSAEGRPRFVLNLPTLWPPSTSWSGGVRLGGPNGECKGFGCSSDWYQERSVTESIVLSPQRPRVVVNYDQSGELYFSRVYNDVEIDLVANTLSFPVEVITTLGFSESTYALLALAGTIVSGMLGSGWIWKLLDAIKKRSETTRASVRNS